MRRLEVGRPRLRSSHVRGYFYRRIQNYILKPHNRLRLRTLTACRNFFRTDPKTVIILKYPKNDKSSIQKRLIDCEKKTRTHHTEGPLIHYVVSCGELPHFQKLLEYFYLRGRNESWKTLLHLAAEMMIDTETGREAKRKRWKYYCDKRKHPRRN